MTDIEKLTKAKELMDKGYFEDSKEILLSIKAENMPNKTTILNSMIANCFFNIKDYMQAIEYSEKALFENNSNELASLIKYLAFVNLKDYNKAFLEIFGFLNNYPANLYKDTIYELLSDIELGLIKDKDIIDAIEFLAIKNDII